MAPKTTTIIPTSDPMVNIRQRRGSRVACIDVPLAGFRADDVILRPQDDRLLVLKAGKGDVTENPSSDDVIIREVALPESVDPYTMEARMHEGMLTVVAPLKC